MPRWETISEDLITGQLAPVGHITGFPRPRIKSAWPTPIGKPLTNRMIAKYEKMGKYVVNTSGVKELKKKQTKAQARQKALEEFI